MLFGAPREGTISRQEVHIELCGIASKKAETAENRSGGVY